MGDLRSAAPPHRTHSCSVPLASLLLMPLGWSDIIILGAAFPCSQHTGDSQCTNRHSMYCIYAGCMNSTKPHIFLKLIRNCGKSVGEYKIIKSFMVNCSWWFGDCVSWKLLPNGATAESRNQSSLKPTEWMIVKPFLSICILHTLQSSVLWDLRSDRGRYTYKKT